MTNRCEIVPTNAVMESVTRRFYTRGQTHTIYIYIPDLIASLRPPCRAFKVLENQNGYPMPFEFRADAIHFMDREFDAYAVELSPADHHWYRSKYLLLELPVMMTPQPQIYNNLSRDEQQFLAAQRREAKRDAIMARQMLLNEGKKE